MPGRPKDMSEIVKRVSQAEIEKTVKILKADRLKREAKRKELDAKRAERKAAKAEEVEAEA